MKMRITAAGAAAFLALSGVGCGGGDGAVDEITESPTAVPGMQGGEQTEVGPAVSEQPDV